VIISRKLALCLSPRNRAFQGPLAFRWRHTSRINYAPAVCLAVESPSRYVFDYCTCPAILHPPNVWISTAGRTFDSGHGIDGVQNADSLSAADTLPVHSYVLRIHSLKGVRHGEAPPFWRTIHAIVKSRSSLLREIINDKPEIETMRAIPCLCNVRDGQSTAETPVVMQEVKMGKSHVNATSGGPLTLGSSLTS